MLGKLMKYDLRSCLRKFGPLWIAAVALSVLIGLSFMIKFIHMIDPTKPKEKPAGLSILVTLPTGKRSGLRPRFMARIKQSSRFALTIHTSTKK